MKIKISARKICVKKLLFCSLLFLMNHQTSTILFAILAQKDGLYAYLLKLRNKASNHLADIQGEMYEEIRLLKTNGRLVKAEYMENLYQQILYNYSHRIDLAFNDLNQMITLDGGKLDFYDALNQQKLDLMDEVKLEANKIILPLLSIPFSELKRSYRLSHPRKS